MAEETTPQARELFESLSKIQNDLNVPKERKNTFGGFNYRSAEDILEHLKPVAAKHGCVLILTDDISLVGERFYVRATARLIHQNTGNFIDSVGYAREPASKTKMDDAQVTGGSSSYARKYALCGLFCIADSEDDPDSKDNTQPKTQAKPATQTPPPPAPVITPKQSMEEAAKLMDEIAAAKTESELSKVSLKVGKANLLKTDREAVVSAGKQKKDELQPVDTVEAAKREFDVPDDQAEAEGAAQAEEEGKAKAEADAQADADAQAEQDAANSAAAEAESNS